MYYLLLYYLFSKTFRAIISDQYSNTAYCLLNRHAKRTIDLLAVSVTPRHARRASTLNILSLRILPPVAVAVTMSQCMNDSDTAMPRIAGSGYQRKISILGHLLLRQQCARAVICIIDYSDGGCRL